MMELLQPGGLLTNGLLAIIAYLLKSMHEDMKKMRTEFLQMSIEQSVMKEKVSDHEKRITAIEQH